MTTESTKPRFFLFDELDRGFNQLMSQVLQNDPRKADAPRLSVCELDDRFVVECDLPGVKLEDIQLNVNDGVLEISGERKTTIDQHAKVTVNERTFSEFNRRLQLGKHINGAAIDAEFGDGVLKVTVPKSSSSAARQIPIRKVEKEF